MLHKSVFQHRNKKVKAVIKAEQTKHIHLQEKIINSYHNCVGGKVNGYVQYGGGGGGGGLLIHKFFRH